MLPMLRFFTALGPVVAMMFVRTDRRLVETLLSAGAIDPGRATALDASGVIRRWRLSRLMSVGAVRAARPGSYYFDADGYAGYRRRRRRRALIVIASMLLVSVILANLLR
jgi:hypothetical protein